MESAEVSVNRSIYNGIVNIIKRTQVLLQVETQMNLENTMLSEGSQSQATVYCVIPFIG